MKTKETKDIGEMLRERMMAEGYRTQATIRKYVASLKEPIRIYIANQLNRDIKELEQDRTYVQWRAFVVENATPRNGLWVAILTAFSHLLHKEIKEEPITFVEDENTKEIEMRFEELWSVVDVNSKFKIIRNIQELQNRLGITLKFFEIQLEEELKNYNRRLLSTIYANCDKQKGVAVEQYRTGENKEGISLYAFEKNICVWVNNEKEDEVLSVGKLIDTWSSSTDLPMYWSAVDRNLKTYIVMPLVFNGLHSDFGFISFESYEYKRMPDNRKEKGKIKALLLEIARIVADNIIRVEMILPK